MPFCNSLNKNRKSKIGILTTIITVCLTVTHIPHHANAANFSGEYLHKVCSLDKDGNETVAGGKIACQAYISGVIDYHNMLRAMDLTSDMNFCIPVGVSLNELQLKVLMYLSTRNKLHRKFVAAPAVTMALYSFYPCK